MGEYWKSLPRKFCDMCKCWFADNKASIEFHERGKRHIENAAKRIQEIQKRGIKEAKKQKKLEDDLEKIEKAALAAYKKDLQNEATSCLEMENAKALLQNVATTPKETATVENTPKETVLPPQLNKKDKKKSGNKKTSKAPSKVWYEAMTAEGYKYYWNSKNSESSWEPPSEGYVSLEEQSQAHFNDDKKDKEIIVEPVNDVGPQPKADPYGKWTTIEHKIPEEVDLQLPKPSEDVEEVVIPIATDEPRLKIKEKVIGQLAGADSSEEVTFKKRKFIGASKRNTRQRIEDD